jgi:hypothetical protein
MKKRRQIHQDWSRIGADKSTLDIAAGTVCVTDEKGKTKRYRLDTVYRELIREAYERGRTMALPYTSNSL